MNLNLEVEPEEVAAAVRLLLDAGYGPVHVTGAQATPKPHVADPAVGIPAAGERPAGALTATSPAELATTVGAVQPHTTEQLTRASRSASPPRVSGPVQVPPATSERRSRPLAAQAPALLATTADPGTPCDEWELEFRWDILEELEAGGPGSLRELRARIGAPSVEELKDSLDALLEVGSVRRAGNRGYRLARRIEDVADARARSAS